MRKKTMLSICMTLVLLVAVLLTLYQVFPDSKPFVPLDFYLQFPLQYGEPPTIDVQLGGSTWKFVIDTGASDSMVNANIINTIGIQRSHGLSLYATNQGPYVFMRNISLKEDPIIGGALVKNVKWAAISVADSERYKGVIDGIIGRDILSSMVLHLDYPNGIGFLVGEACYNKIDISNYNMISMNKRARIAVVIEEQNKKFLVDTGGAFTLMLCKKKPSMAWSDSSNMVQGLALGQSVSQPLKVGALPSIKLGTVALTSVSFFEQGNVLTALYGIIGQYLFEEGAFVFDFLNGNFYFKMNNDYNLSREAGSAIKLEFVYTSEALTNTSTGYIRIVSINPNNPLAIDYGLMANDRVVKIDSESFIAITSEPNSSDLSHYIGKIVMQRFESLELLRDGTAFTLYNVKQRGALDAP